MARALWNGKLIAESDDIVVVEGNRYFPRESVRSEYLEPSAKHSRCPWKGKASYFSLAANDERADDAVWYYPRPSILARRIKGRVAFGRGVTVEA